MSKVNGYHEEEATRIVIQCSKLPPKEMLKFIAAALCKWEDQAIEREFNALIKLAHMRQKESASHTYRKGLEYMSDACKKRLSERC